jgi:hypothetical protein
MDWMKTTLKITCLFFLASTVRLGDIKQATRALAV